MKKGGIFVLFLSAASAAAALDSLLSLAAAAGAANGSTPPALEQQQQADAGLRAVCQEREVEIDEGYGISSREKRFVCDSTR